MPHITNECLICGMCLDYCKFDAIKLDTRYGSQYVIDQLKCKGCKECLKVDCPGEAIKDLKNT